MNAPELLDVIQHEQTDERDTGVSDENDPKHRSVGLWGLLLILVIVFGYLTASRRKALGTLIEQIADIIRDFRGYDPGF